MIDIHNHLIPNVDDGAGSIDESIKMIEAFKKSGYSGAICTSHYYPDKYEVKKDIVLEGIELLKVECGRRGIEFELYPGNEVFLDANVGVNLDTGLISTLNDSRYVLIELPFLSKPHYARNMLYELQLKGYIPVLAHCERYKYVQEDPDWLLDFIKAGCLIQVNIGSIKASHSTPEYKTIKELLERRMVHILATDAHTMEWRTPDVTKALNILKDEIDEEYFEKILIKNPEMVAKNLFIDAEYDSVVINKDEDEKSKKKKNFFQKLFNRQK